MALETQRTLLRSFVQLMRDEGIVNDEFYQLQAMKETVRQDYVVRAVTSYCLSAQNLFSQLTYHISQPEIDYHLVHAAAHELYARTSSIGAEHVKISCAELIQACEQNDKEYCSRALYWTKNEYSKLRRKFETLVQLLPLFQIWNSLISKFGSCSQIVIAKRTHLDIKLITTRTIGSAKENPIRSHAAHFLNGKRKLWHLGILSDQNSLTQTLIMEPDCALQKISSYCTGVETMLLQLTSCIELLDVDFSQLAILARQIEEKSSCFGAEHVRLACTDLIQACDQMNKRNFNRALDWLKNEFSVTKKKLEPVTQMERKIMRLLLKEQQRHQQP